MGKNLFKPLVDAYFDYLRTLDMDDTDRSFLDDMMPRSEAYRTYETSEVHKKRISGKAYVKYRSNSQICSCFFRIGYHSSIYPFSAVPPYISKDGPSTCS